MKKSCRVMIFCVKFAWCNMMVFGLRLLVQKLLVQDICEYLYVVLL